MSAGDRHLPIEAVLPELLSALRTGTNAVLQAPPGAGKTTRVPLALLGEAWRGDGRIVVLEPRRLAVYAAARRMAETLGEDVGRTVGYRMRLDTRVSRDTRIEVVTEGVFIRQLQSDPELSGIAAVLFDEYHERSLDADLGLALCLEVQSALRPELRLLAMSATLDGARVARLLDDAPTVVSEGRSFPVETLYLPPKPEMRLEDAVAGAIRRVLGEEDGSLLVFLPGAGEIRRVQARLQDAPLAAEVDVVPLYGDLAQDVQRRAIQPAAPGRRKVVLATSIAETSLTIEGVRVVVDGGYARKPRFDPRSGMARLETVRVSRAAADQRRGRAGRTEAGLCYRLWSEASHRALAPFDPPEISAADLTPLALDLALWGVADPESLAWLDPPPAAAFARARELLHALGGIDRTGGITAHGREMASLGAHPRLAHMMLAARRLGDAGTACDLAALLGERDPLRGVDRDADIRSRLAGLHGGGAGSLDRSVIRSAARVAAMWRRQLRVKETKATVGAGQLVALAYPDRLAQRRPGSRGEFRLRNGRGAVLPAADALAGEDWLAVADLDGGASSARIRLAAPVALGEIEAAFAGEIESVDVVAWDPREEAVVARRQRRLGALVLAEEPLSDAGARVVDAVLDGIRSLGLAALPWTAETTAFRSRIALLRRVEGDMWPDVSDAGLLDTLGAWLGPSLGGVSRRTQFGRIDLASALRGLVTWDLQQALDRKAPTHLDVPSGSRIRLDYESGDRPILAVRLQEMFGAIETPRLADGKVPVLVHLLSPAGRPAQVTQDLASFWTDGYRSVRADLRGRYPKHHWPEDPLDAAPTRHAKPRGTGPAADAKRRRS